jgi:predicted nucleic acid-binding protein
MTFAQIPAGAAIFLDANALFYHFTNDQVLPITQPLIEATTLVSQQYELLTGDALIVAVMQGQGLTNIASNDADFDRVPGLIRYTPV